VNTLWTPHIAACVLAAGLLAPPVARASGPAVSADTARILDAIEAGRSQRTPADRQAARRLNAEGDRAYRKGDYRAAFTAYANSYPNRPNAYAYIMAGDAHWRAVVQHQASPADAAASAPATCSLDNSRFARDLATDLAQHHEVGLALAAREKDRRFMRSSVYRRARESSACLQGLVRDYQRESPQACVDVDRLRRCLGTPLVK
jgi:hypothetical protein